MNTQRGHCIKSVQIASFFWSVFSYIWTDHGDLLHKSPNSVRIQENTDQKIIRTWTLFTQWEALTRENDHEIIYSYYCLVSKKNDIVTRTF